MNDVFTPNAFKNHELTAAINLSPFQPGRIQSMGLFSSRNVYRTHVDIEYKSGRLSLVQSKPRGSREGMNIVEGKRTLRSFKIPHLPQYATITADDLPNVRSFGTVDGIRTVNEIIADRLQEMRQNLETTIEYHMTGALKGVVKDADGSTLLDLYDEFGISQEELDIDTANDDIKGKFMTLTRTVQDLLGGTPFNYIWLLCGDSFYDNIVLSPEVEDAYSRQQGGVFKTDSQVRGSFTYAGIVLENYRGFIGDTKFIEDDEAIAIPVGASGLFVRYNGPADTMDAVGSSGKPFVVTREFLPHEQGVQLRGQANPLIMNTRPGVIVKVNDTTGAS